MHRPPRRVSRFTIPLAGALLLGGCYEHVVKDTGAGASGRPVYEPNVVEETDKGPWTNAGKSGGTTKRPGSKTFSMP